VEIADITLLLHTKKPITKNELVEPFIRLLHARRNKKFRGLFKVNKNGKIINFIMSKSEMKRTNKKTP